MTIARDKPRGRGSSPAPVSGWRSFVEHASAPANARRISFDDPDSAYRASVALRRALDATVASDVVLVPTADGPGLELGTSAVSVAEVQAIIREFHGHPDVRVDTSEVSVDAWRDRDVR